MFQRSTQASSRSYLRHLLFYTRTTADHFIFILDRRILSIWILVRDLGRCQRECYACVSRCRQRTRREEVLAVGILGSAEPILVISFPDDYPAYIPRRIHPRRLRQVAGLDGEFGGTGLDIRWGSNKLQQNSSREGCHQDATRRGWREGLQWGLIASQPPTTPRVSYKNSGCPTQRACSLGRRGWTGSDLDAHITTAFL